MPITNYQHLSLVLSTCLLISSLVILELIYNDKPRPKPANLGFFLPICIALFGLTLLAIYGQGRGV